MSYRHGLIVDGQATIADGLAEREAATTMLSTHRRFAPRRPRRVGADKAYDTADFVGQVGEAAHDSCVRIRARVRRRGPNSDPWPRGHHHRRRHAATRYRVFGISGTDCPISLAGFAPAFGVSFCGRPSTLSAA